MLVAVFAFQAWLGGYSWPRALGMGAAVTMVIIPISLLVAYPLEALALAIVLVKAGVAIITTAGR
jgi:hypothetical protein